VHRHEDDDRQHEETTAEGLIRELGEDDDPEGRDGGAGDALSPNVEAQQESDSERPDAG
jgi:hypothetical protein